MRAVLLLLFALCAVASEPTVRLRAQASVAATQATIGDCADLAGDPAAVGALAALPVLSLPDLAPRTLEAGQVRAALVRAGLQAQVQGSCRVVRPARMIEAGDLIDAARAAVPRVGDDEVMIAVVRCSGAATVADCGRPPRLLAEPLTPSLVGECAFRVRILDGDAEAARGLVVLSLRRLRQAAVAARPLARGQVVGAGDLRLAQIEVAPATTAATVDLASLVGRTLRLEVAAGQAVVPGMLIDPPAVIGGQPVELVVRVGAAELSAPGAALADGRVGQAVMVRRGDGRQVRGTVLAPGRVLLTP